MYYVYILQSQKSKSYYTGTTENLKERLKDHKWCTVKTTKANGPYKLVWYCVFTDKQKAYAFEKYLKSGSGRAFMKRHLI